MMQCLLLFLAPEHASQATQTSPPAAAQPVKPLAKSLKNLKFGASVLGNTIGLVAILAGCWCSVRLIQVLMIS